MKRLLWISGILAAIIILATSLFTAPGRAEIPAPQSSMPQDVNGSPYMHLKVYVSADSYVDQLNPTTNYGTSTAMYTSFVNLKEKRSLLKFDLTSLPANATVITATLSLYNVVNLADQPADGLLAPADHTFTADAANSAWVENTVTYNTRPTGTNYDSAYAACLSNGWSTISVKNTVQNFINGTKANNGFLLRTGFVGTCEWLSREGAGIYQPVLDIYYTATLSPAVFPSTQETYISQLSPSTNYGASSTLLINKVKNGLMYSLLDFDISSLPAEIEVITATLNLYTMINLNAPSEPAAYLIQPNAILTSWNENTVNWNSGITSSYRNDTTSSYVFTEGWTKIDVSKLVSDWVNGTVAENGILLQASGGSAVGQATFTVGTANIQPYLKVTYAPICRALTAVVISGPTAGTTGQQYTFTVTPTPANASTPLTYAWTATGQSGVSGASANFTWNSPGTYTVNVSGSNCGGTVNQSLQVVISNPQPACTTPVTGVTLAGPTKGIVAASYSFDGASTPLNATTPITLTWTVTDKSPVYNYTASASRSWSWSTSGTKTIQLKTKNCGGEYITSQNIQIFNLADLPDLQVTSLWYEPDVPRIGYLVENTGALPVDPGWEAGAYKDNVSISNAIFTGALPAASIRTGYINTSWSCSAASAVIKVCVDRGGTVLEGNETNNCYQETWACDATAPNFTSAINVTPITEAAATFNFTTNEATTVRIRYGLNSGIFDVSASFGSSTSHSRVVSGLVPGKTYNYIVEITDAAGNTSNSTTGFFSTNPLGSTPPVNTGVTKERYPDLTFEIYTFKATYTAPDVIERVSYALHYTDRNGAAQIKSLGISSAAPDFPIHFNPAYWGLQRGELYRANQIVATAYTIAGASTVTTSPFSPGDPGRMLETYFTKPDPDTRLFVVSLPAPAGTALTAIARGYQFEWQCIWSGPPPAGSLPEGQLPVYCDSVKSPVTQLKFYLDGLLQSTVTPNEWAAGSHTFALAAKAGGTHKLKVCAHTSPTVYTCAEQNMTIEQGQAQFEVTRSVVRDGNFFNINLFIKNTGSLELKIYSVEDWVKQVQPSSFAPNGANYTITSDYNSETRSARVAIEKKTTSDSIISLGPNSSSVVTYRVTPALYPNSASAVNDYRIGHLGIKIRFMPLGSTSLQTFAAMVPGLEASRVDNPADLKPFALAVYDAISGSDFLMVTNPARLNAFFDIEEMDALLEHMAELARYENGILGYLDPISDFYTIKALIRGDGTWGKMMHPNYRVYNKGYVMFVGEVEIVPSRYESTDVFTTSPGIPDKVRHSDLRYADWRSNTHPELVLGRIPGNESSTMLNYLLNAIKYHRSDPQYTFDRSDALVFSGRGEGVTSHFVPNVNKVASILTSDGWTVAKFHALDIGGDDAAWNAISSHMPNKDVIYFRDHGNVASMGGILTTGRDWDPGNSAPFVFSVACLAGNYEDGDGSHLVDHLDDYHTLVYIGATEISVRSTNNDASKYFFNHWPVNMSIGAALNNARIYIWGEDLTYDDGKLWSYEYMLFGSPKIGLSAADMRTPPASLSMSTPSNLNANVSVTLPDYTVSTVDGKDVIEIDGGSTLFEPGQALLPYWIETIQYPAGTVVTGVTLSSVSDPLAASGLNIGTFIPSTNCLGCDPVMPVPPAQVMTWWPNLDTLYTWSVSRSDNGGTELRIVVYPFFYEASTGSARFYKDFVFNVTSNTTTASLAKVWVDEETSALGGQPVFGLEIANPGLAQDLIIEAAVRRSDGTTVDGLPLRLIHAVAGSFFAELTWDQGAQLRAAKSPDAPLTGDFILEVRLLNTSSVEIDFQALDFTIGTTSAAATSLAKGMPVIKPGTNMPLSLGYTNTGDLPLSGKAVIQVFQSDGQQIANFTQDISALAPAAAGTFNTTWNTTGASGDYRVVGYIEYAGQTSTFLQMNLGTNARLYLPFVRR